MRIISPAAASLVLALLAAPPAHAQTCIGPGGVLSNACSDSGLGRLVGAFGQVGAAGWRDTAGLAVSVGVLHAHPVGGELTLLAPAFLPSTTRPLVPTFAALRFAIWRGGISGDWTDRTKAPDLGLILGVRAGGGAIWGLDKPAAATLGPLAELLVGGWLIVALRPTLSIAAKPEGAPPGGLPFDLFPMIDLTIGSLAEGVYAPRKEVDPPEQVIIPAVSPTPAPAPTPPPAPEPATPAPAAPPPVEPAVSPAPATP